MLQPLTFINLPIVGQQANHNLIIFINWLARPDHMLKVVNFKYFDSTISLFYAVGFLLFEYAATFFMLIAFWDILVKNTEFISNLKNW